MPKSNDISVGNIVEYVKSSLKLEVKVEDIFKEYQKKKYNKEPNNEFILEASDLVLFISCPRQFLLKMLEETTGVKSPVRKTQQMLRGEFWHKVFKEAAKDTQDRFNSRDENEIAKCLIEKFDEVKKNYHIEEFESYNDDLIKEKILKQFAKNEAKRREIGYRTIETEIRKTCDVKVDINGNIFIYKIIGNIDRIDIINNNHVIIDYKIKEKIKKLNFLKKDNNDKNNLKLYPDKSSLQLAIYSFIFKNSENYQGKIKCGIINIFGEDEIDEIRYNRENHQERVFELIENSINTFHTQFLSKQIDIKLDNAFFFNNGVANRDYDELDLQYGGCKCCEYNLLCLGLITQFKDK